MIRILIRLEGMMNQLLAVEFAADVLWVDFHFTPEEYENISPPIHRIIFQGRLYTIRRNIWWD